MTPDGTRLLDEILGDPKSDTARLIFADYLLQHDDPRGELITLQMQGELTPAQRRRELELVSSPLNLEAWLGPLARVVSEPIFKRGFLQSCAVDQLDEPLIEHPNWATVESIACTELALVESPAMRSLTEVRGLPVAQIAELAARDKAVAIEALVDVELERDDDQDDVAPWKKIVEVGALAKLRRLGLQATDTESVAVADWAWLLESKLGRQLASLTLELGKVTPPIKEWLAQFRKLPELDELAIKSCGKWRGFGACSTDFTVIARRETPGRARVVLTLELERPFLFDSKEDASLDELDDIKNLFANFPSLATNELAVIIATKCTPLHVETLQARLAKTLRARFKRVTVKAG